MEEIISDSFINISKGNSLIAFPDDYTVFDIETTGFDPNNDEIIEIAAIRVRNNTVKECFTSLVKPNNEVSAFVANLTGITNEMLETAEDIKSVLSQFIDFVGTDIVVGHNVSFDINFINNNSVKCFQKAFCNDYVDTLRLSRKYVQGAEDHKLQTLIQYFNIESDTAHRALADCYSTQKLYDNLRIMRKEFETHKYDVKTICNGKDAYKGKRIFISGKFKTLSEDELCELLEYIGAIRVNIFYGKSTDIFIMSDYAYRNYLQKKYSYKMEKANMLKDEGTLEILSEFEFLKSLGIEVPSSNEKRTSKTKSHWESIKIKISELSTSEVNFNTEHPLYKKCCVFTGTLEKLPRKEAMQKVLDFGGAVANSITSKTNYLILGNNDYCASLKGAKSSKQKKAEQLIQEGKDIQIISEDSFYDMLKIK